MIFFEKNDKIFAYYIKEFPHPPKHYSGWNQKKYEQSSSFANCKLYFYIDISINFSENFIKSLIFQVNSIYPEVIAIVKKYEKTSDELSGEEFYKSILEDVLSKFEPSEFNAMQSFHKSLSIAAGENIGLKTYNFKQKSIISLSNLFYFNYKDVIDKFIT